MRPYRHGSRLDFDPPEAPEETLNYAWQDQWISRVAAYWPHGNSAARRIARAIISFRGPSGRVMPSLARIADRAQCSIRTISRFILATTKAGFLSHIRRRTSEGQTSNAYCLLMPGKVAEQAAAPSSMPSVDMSNDRKEHRDAGSLDRLPVRNDAPPGPPPGPLQALWRSALQKLDFAINADRYQQDANDSADMQLRTLGITREAALRLQRRLSWPRKTE